VLSVLRQPRYAALSALMAVVALVCIAAGTWQIARFEQKRSENQHLRANARDPAVAVASLLPVVGAGSAPSRSRLEFRTVTATGRFDPAGQVLVRNRTVGDANGFLVVTPLRTAGAVLLVARGFLPQPDSGATPTAPPPPAGTVTITARAHSPESRHDQAALLNDSQVESINPGDQARRLGVPVYNGYAELEAKQPGTKGLTVLPGPDLSNPAGGALEPQHFAYVIQWYLFAALAVAAPFAMARAETKAGRKPRIDFDAASDPAPDTSARSDEERRAAKLADRYGRPVA
jgi:cytochrome oxidase assembly protein ShyY1